MAYRPPRTWTTGEPVTNWKLNTELRDNTLAARSFWGHGCHLSLASAQTVEPNQRTAVDWNVVDWMVGTEIWSSGQGSRLLAPVPGYYELNAILEVDNASGGIRELGYTLNGKPLIYALDTLEDAQGARTPALTGSAVVSLTTADYLEVGLLHTLVDELNISGGNPDRTRCSWKLLGAAS